MLQSNTKIKKKIPYGELRLAMMRREGGKERGRTRKKMKGKRRKWKVLNFREKD